MSDDGNWRAIIEQDDYSRRMTLRLGRNRFDGYETLAGATLNKYQPSDLATDDGLTRLPTDEMRELLKAIMDEAWRIGVRPSDTTADTVIAAKDKHLEDMRAIAFHKVGAEKPA